MKVSPSPVEEELGEDIVVDDEVDEGSLIVGEGQLLIVALRRRHLVKLNVF